MPYFRHQFWDAEVGPGITVTKLLGAICLLYALVYLAHRHAIPRYFATPQSWLMITFFGLAAFSYLTRGLKASVADFVNPIYMYVSSLVLFFVTITIIDSIKRLYWSFMVAIGSVAFASLYMLREWQRGTAAFGEGYRPGFVVGDSNYFTVAALAVLPIGFELALMATKKWEKLYAVGCMLLIFAAITLGASRGGFLGIVLIVFYLIARSRRPVRNLVVVFLATLPFLIFAPKLPDQPVFPSRRRRHGIGHQAPGGMGGGPQHDQEEPAGRRWIRKLQSGRRQLRHYRNHPAGSACGPQCLS